MSDKKVARVWDMIDPSIGRVAEEVASARLSACRGCEHFIKLTGQCKHCMCFMRLKTTLPHAECPIGKWGREDEQGSSEKI